MSREKLQALLTSMQAKKTSALLVIRNDKIVCEWYAPGHDAQRRQGTASLAKALFGGLSLAVAITDGKLSLDDPAARFITSWNHDPRKAHITLRHLGSHTSGLDDAESGGLAHHQLSGWKGDFWKRLPVPDDPFTIARDRTEMLFEPGQRLAYSNPGIAMLGYCVTAAIQESPHQDLRTLIRERLMRPIGVEDREWSVGYNQTFEVDGLALVPTWGGGTITPRAAARLGRLVLREGDWEGRQILSPQAVRAVTQDAGLPGHCGMGWWTNAGGRYSKLPRDAVWGAGAGDQLLLVIPSLKLILVRNGQTLAPGPDEPPLKTDDVFTRFHDYRANVLFEPLVDAVLDRPTQASGSPYPPSSVIAQLQWAPRETIVRQAPGSDNWPLTWGDDDHLYTAYGDGRGFVPHVPEKLSLGLARIEGPPQAFRGVNLRSPTIEQHGDGPAGKKASGILMVQGVLYLWVRNAASAQLAWSHDRGQTWHWADWKFTTSFGCPTFLQFGPDGAGALDGYVYVYSPDSDSAYELADGLVLARVPRQRISERAAYEFFAGLDARGQPRWTHDLAQRQPVLVHPGRCYRTSVSFHRGLGRYLCVQTMPAPGTSRGRDGRVDTRFEGGLAIFDAPQPWGPWTTVFYTQRWDVGPGDTASFPTKWMDLEGQTLWLVFSGDDAFSVRQVRLHLAQAASPAASSAAVSAQHTPVALQGPPAPAAPPRSILPAPALGAAAGPLRVHPDNPRYFTDGTRQPDGTLRAVYLTGSHTWNNLVDMPREADAPPLDYAAYLDFLERHGHNFIRLWAWDSTVWDTRANGRQAERPGVHRVAPHPWRRTGPGEALDGLPKFDLTQFDPAYFQRLRQRVEEAGRRGIYVSVMLFEGWGLMHANRGRAAPEGWAWRSHPFHPANNINNLTPPTDASGVTGRVHALGNEAVNALQAAYIRHVVDTVNDLDNVLFEVINEGGEKDWDWWVVQTIQQYERSKPKRHPVGLTGHGAQRVASMLASPADWVSPGRNDGYGEDPPAWNERKPSLLDTDHIWGVGGTVDWAWKTFVRGHHPLFMDPYQHELLGRGAPAQWDPLRRALGQTRRLAQRLNLTRMAPRNELASTGYCLADVGRAYVVYLPQGGQATVDLTGASGALAVEWIDPVHGTSTAGQTVRGGGRQRLEAPREGAVVLYLRQAD
jgi:CubicO group peptidase (beta-lactamase class C family)